MRATEVYHKQYRRRKDKITVEDIFKDSPAFDNVLREEYKELKNEIQMQN